MKSFWIRLGVFCALFGATILGCLVFSNPQTDPVAGVITWLPDEFMGHHVYDGKMGELEKKWLPADTSYVKKIYLEKWRPEEEAVKRALFATLLVAGADSRSLHRPKVCLKGQHWSITQQEVVKLETKGGPLEVMDFHIERVLTGEDNRALRDENGKAKKVKAHYVYWWIGPDVSTPSDEKRVLYELWNSIRKGRRERWAYPSVQVAVDERYGKEEAQERAYDFIRQFAPRFQKSLGAEGEDRGNFLGEISTEGS